MYLVQFIRGFCMALADSVPGVSGGTVAFLLGFYDQFIDSIDDLITGSREKKKAALFFLIKLGTGWVCGMILAILILASVFDAHIYAISSLFIGFIIFAIPIIFREEKNCLAAKKSAIPFVLIGVAIVTAITYFNPSSGGEGVSLEHLTPGLALFVFLGCGVLVGIFGVVKLIRKALDHFRAQTIYLIIGLMLGSIYAVVMGPTTLEVPQPAMTLHDFNILFFVIGGALIIGLQKMKDLKA